MHPLKTLLKTGQTWKWDQECENVFRAAKQKLNSSSVLAQYDSKLPIRLAEDIYCYRIGAVLSRILPNVIEHPVRYASRTLKSSEKNYVQLKKEALLLIYGISTVHDMENLTFSEEFRGCRAPRNFRAGGRGFFVRAGADLPRRWARSFRADLV